MDGNRPGWRHTLERQCRRPITWHPIRKHRWEGGHG
jgi:hypothetical protein